MNSLKNTKRNSERCQNYSEEEKHKRKKKGPRKISKSL